MTQGILPPPAASNGTNGADGTNGTNGTDGSVWRVGTGAPSNGLGQDGDFYLDEATGNVYLKASGTYSIAANIKGDAGAATVITKDEGVTIDAAATTLNFVGSGVTVTDAGGGVSTITFDSAATAATVITWDESNLVDASATTLNFVGSGVVASDAGGGVTTITIPGGDSVSAGSMRISYLLFGAFCFG